MVAVRAAITSLSSAGRPLLGWRDRQSFERFIKLVPSNFLFARIVHPLVQPGALKPPSVATLERRNKTFRSILVECVGADAEVVRRRTKIH